MENIHELIESLHLDSYLTIDDIPELDLYMDQVIQLFERKYADTKRNEEEKILTKTMINNYAKGKLFFPVKNKKYTKEHIMLISMVYQMKSALSINDIKKVLDIANNDTFDLEGLYKSYENISENNVNRFKEQSLQINAEVAEEVSSDEEDMLYKKQLLMVASFTHMSNVYRRAAEKIVDQMEEGQQSKKE
ncbi:DUF1836 domain-containing protein [Oceanobacillus bengalensis]|uniref:DUF1836 domain-containing protein n=1 Tax=Oceanobacillus bengalensis TaxID=1435466 RepID=A0A494YXS6_9BACI|nr:DUF1836 domain-containing protein [Oceanobacillus bengalensis]RKQ15019.1 DUF1836 domain-containing protein [Oceanobacillus bengalensis]